MPELPEVEVTRRGLQTALVGCRVTGLALGQPLRWPLGCDAHTLVGQSVVDLQRRGKYLLLQLERGSLIIHLGMSGSLRWLSGSESSNMEPERHEHFVLQTDRGQLRLLDPRRFGAVVWQAAAGPLHPLLAKLGPEPLEPGFDGPALARALHGRRAAIKPLLLDQAVVAGVGNIYASEALFDAAIDPRMAGGRLSGPRCARLAEAVRATLQQAVAAGGSTLRNFAHVDGEFGCFQHAARVYGRAGQPCQRCAGPIRQIRQGQRSTYFCPRCQKR